MLGLYGDCFLSIVIFISLTSDVNLSIQLLFLSNVSTALKVTPLLVISLHGIVVTTSCFHEWGGRLSSQLSV